MEAFWGSIALATFGSKLQAQSGTFGETMLTQNEATTEPGHLYEAVNVRLTPIEWLICAVACLGFAFDIYESLMLPLIVRPAITTLSHLKPGTPAFNMWVGLLFYIPNLAGGVFGLLGGYFTDRWGRRRILFWSILLYSLSACAASYSTSLTQLLILRCTTLIGISVEFVAGITWLAELFPHAKRRESVLGGTQAFSALGGLMATGAYYLSVTYAERMPAIGHRPRQGPARTGHRGPRHIPHCRHKGTKCGPRQRWRRGAT